MAEFFKQINVPEKVDDVTIERDATNGLQVKESSLTELYRASATSLTLSGGTQTISTIQHNDKSVILITIADDGTYTSSATTAIANGSVLGQQLTIKIIASTANGYLKLLDSANTVLQGNFYAYLEDASISLVWNGSNWVEVCRDNLHSATSSGRHSHAEGYSTIASGSNSHSEGSLTFATGYAAHADGYYNTAEAGFSYAGGKYSVARRYSEFTRSSGRFSSTGDSQYGTLHLLGSTADSDWHTIYSDKSPSNIIDIQRESLFSFKIRIHGVTQDIAEAADYEINGSIKNVGGAMTLISSVVTTYSEDDAAWDVQTIIDAMNEALSVQVKGNGEIIYWTARIDFIETKFT